MNRRYRRQLPPFILRPFDRLRAQDERKQLLENGRFYICRSPNLMGPFWFPYGAWELANMMGTLRFGVFAYLPILPNIRGGLLLLSFPTAFIGDPFFSFSSGLDSRLRGNDGRGRFFIFHLVSLQRMGTRERMSMLVGQFGHAIRRVCKIQFNSMETLTMDIQLETLEAEALKLTSGERAAFAQLLLASLDEDTEIEDAWAGEVERRINEIESGAVQVVPISEALAQVRAALK